MSSENHIFYAPHSDDETLSMGASILQHLAQAHRVFLVLLTDGAKDETRQCLNGEFPCKWHKRTHDPAEENFHYVPLTEEAFLRARRQEFMDAAKLLGVPESDIQVAMHHDSELPLDQMRELVLSFETHRNIPGPKFHHTMSDKHDTHPDHVTAGRALRELLQEDKIQNATWYIKRSMWKKVEEDSSVINIVADDPKQQETLRRIRDEVFARYEPAKGHFAIGYHSVPDSFNGMLENFTNKMHR